MSCLLFYRWIVYINFDWLQNRRSNQCLITRSSGEQRLDRKKERFVYKRSVQADQCLRIIGCLFYKMQLLLAVCEASY